MCMTLYFVFKMCELTTAASDAEIVTHFKEVLSQYVMEYQVMDESSLGTPSSSKSDKHIVTKVEDSLTKVIEGLTENEVRPV